MLREATGYGFGTATATGATAAVGSDTIYDAVAAGATHASLSTGASPYR